MLCRVGCLYTETAECQWTRDNRGMTLACRFYPSWSVLEWNTVWLPHWHAPQLLSATVLHSLHSCCEFNGWIYSQYIRLSCHCHWVYELLCLGCIVNVMNIPHIGNTVVRSVREGLETKPLDQSLNVVTISSCWCVYVRASSVATLKITFHKLFLGCYIYCARTAIQNYYIIIDMCCISVHTTLVLHHAYTSNVR